MTNLRALVRKLILDIGETVNDYHTFNTDTLAGRTWTLSEENPDSSTLLVYKNDTLVASTNYTFTSATNQVVVNSGVLTVTDRVRVTYTAYKKYSTNEIDAYIEHALAWLSLKKYQDFYIDSINITPNPSLGERRLIALIAAILINGNLLSYKTKEFEVKFNPDSQGTVESKIESILKDFEKSLGVWAWIANNEDVI